METQETQQTPGGDGAAASAERVVGVEAGVLPAWAVEYLKANPLSVAWQSMLAIGGAILALHSSTSASSPTWTGSPRWRSSPSSP
jgi:hypothetical protein